MILLFLLCKKKILYNKCAAVLSKQILMALRDWRLNSELKKIQTRFFWCLFFFLFKLRHLPPTSLTMLFRSLDQLWQSIILCKVIETFIDLSWHLIQTNVQTVFNLSRNSLHTLEIDITRTVGKCEGNFFDIERTRKRRA